jgi:putative peptide zinc metalloprotease protein
MAKHEFTRAEKRWDGLCSIDHGKKSSTFSVFRITLDNNLDNSRAHHSTVELASCRLNLRSDLLFHLQEYQGAQCYLVEDEFNSRFFRIGLSEYHLISLLDGSKSLSEAVAISAAQMGEMALGEQDAINIFKWLIDNELASTDASRTSGRLIENFEKADRRKQKAKLNPVTPKFNLFNPDALLEKLNASVGWLFSFPMFVVWALVVATGVYQVFANWDDLVSGNSSVLARENWIWLGLTWLGLKVIHECAHGMVCKRFMGEVRQCGMVLILMIPLPFVDVTSSWRFSSKWQRIFVAAAGMYVEVFLAAAAAIVWSYSDPGIIRQQALNLMIAGSVTTLFFNANPLMRFDGYYMLSDWLELPNLGTHGQQWIQWVGKKYYLGLDVKRPEWPEGCESIIGTYSVLALWWKVIICVGLAVLAESLFYGAGIALALLATIFWVVVPLWKLLKMVFIGEETQEQPSRIRFCLLTTGLAIAGWAFCTQAPWYSRVKAHAIVEFQNSSEIRTPVGGFLEEIFVKQGQLVKKGQILARLSNPHLDADVEKLMIDIESTNSRIRSLRNSLDLAACDVEQKNLQSLNEQLEKRLSQQRDLELISTGDGVVVGDDLHCLPGVYFGPGHMVCSVESESEKEVQAMVSQYDFELFQNRVGEPVDIHIWGEGSGYFQASLEHVNSRGRVDLPHPAFSAMSGGPLPVQYQAPDPNQPESDSQVALISPHFLAQVTLSDDDSARLKSGQPAIVSFRANRGTFGSVLKEKITQWIRVMREQTAAAQNL